MKSYKNVKGNSLLVLENLYKKNLFNLETQSKIKFYSIKSLA